MNTSKIRALIVITVSGVLLAMSTSALAQTSILNVSYDVSRELYKDINPAFVASWQSKGIRRSRSTNRMAVPASR